MIIECQCCSRKFNLNEKLLKPTGSRVRCTKCGTIFNAYPAMSDPSLNSVVDNDDMTKDADQGQSVNPGFEKREHPRIPLHIPVLCDALDPKGNPFEISLGTIKEIGQNGLAIELFSSPACEHVLLSFLNVENRDVQIKAKVVHSKTEGSFKTRVGLSLTGSAAEIDHFVSQAMRAHHSSDSVDQRLHPS